MKRSISRWPVAARPTAIQPKLLLSAPSAASYSSLSFLSSTTSSFSRPRPSLTTLISSHPHHPLSSPLLLPVSSSSPLLTAPPSHHQPVRHATKKAGGSVKNNSGSPGKHLGLKASGGSHVHTGHLLVTQRGRRTHPGRGVILSRDDTLVAGRSGVVVFTYVLRPYRTRNKWRQYINVVDVKAGETREDVEAETAALADKYVAVLHMKRAGERVPTTRSVYLKKVAAEKREVEKREKEQLIARITGSQDAAGDGSEQQVAERQQ